MRIRCRLTMIALGLAVVWSTASAQERSKRDADGNTEAIFNNGIILYNNGNYAEARAAFRKLTVAGSPNSRITAALLMAAKSSYLLEDYKTAEDDLRRLFADYPNSRYREHGRLLLGLIFYKKNNFYYAAEQFLWLVDYGKDVKLRNKAAQLARILLTDYLEPDDLQELHKETSGIDGLALVVMTEANRDIHSDRADLAKSRIANFLQQNPGTRFKDELKALLDAEGVADAGVKQVGVILPLTGEFAEEGQGVYRGIKFAERRFKQKNGNNPELAIVARNSESNMLKAIAATQQLAQDRNILCIIGELENMITEGICGVAQASGVPIVAPVASEHGIAGLGAYIFQATPDREIQAKALARYAIDSLRLHTFITIAPQDEYGRQMVDAFTAEIDRLGGKIMTERWYYGVPEDLTRQFKELRELAFRQSFEDTLRDDGNELSRARKNALWKAFNDQFVADNKDKKTIAESTEVPVTNIDGVFLPIYQDDIKYVARQLSSFNIRAQILGGEYWYLDKLEQDRSLVPYVNGTIFVSSYFYNPEALAFVSFRDEFRKTIGATPGKWELFGYDAANVVFAALRAGASTRGQMLDNLQQLAPFDGVKGKILFQKGVGINDAVNILQIRDAKIAPLPYEQSETDDDGSY